MLSLRILFRQFPLPSFQKYGPLFFPAFRLFLFIVRAVFSVYPDTLRLIQDRFSSLSDRKRQIGTGIGDTAIAFLKSARLFPQPLWGHEYAAGYKIHFPQISIIRQTRILSASIALRLPPVPDNAACFPQPSVRADQLSSCKPRFPPLHTLHQRIQPVKLHLYCMVQKHHIVSFCLLRCQIAAFQISGILLPDHPDA